MANVKNFGLIGVGSDLQFGKAGPRLVNNAGVFNFKGANGTTDSALTAAGITSSAGNVTLTTGNLVLSDTAGKVTIGGTDMLQRSAGGYPQIAGSASVLVPTGNTAARPGTGVAGMVRVNNDTPAASYVEFYNGTAWAALATGGSTGALQTEIDAIESTLGAMVNSDGTTHVAASLTNSLFGGATDLTTALQNLATGVQGKDTLDEIFPSAQAGNIIYSNGSNVWVQSAPGSTSGVQAYSAKLASLAGNATNGIIVQDSSGSVVSRTLVAPTEGFTITNASGVAGNPTFVLADDLAAIEGLNSTGFAVRTGTSTWAQRSITGTANNIVITNGDGVASSPTIDLAGVTQASSGNFVKVTLDGFGRVTGNTAVTTGDITGLVDGTYVNASGDTMTGNLTFTSGTVTGLPSPTNASDAANKAYVDAATTGLSWKTAVLTSTTANITLSGEQTIDGVLTSGSRVLVKNQTTASQNGIYVSGTGAWVRATDADSAAELDGAAVFVQQGTVGADTGWVQTATIVTVGTTAQTWSQFSGGAVYVGGVGIDISGNTISAKLGDGITNLPTGEIGLDIASNVAIQLTDGTSTGQLTLVLDTGSGLAQSSTGLKINTASVTNAMLVNPSITLDGDAGSTGTIALGSTLNVIGTSAQGISTSVSGSTYTITAANATTAAKGVASFNSASFSVSSGAVSLNTVDVAHGGTGATSFVANELIFGNGTSALSQSANLTFASDVLTVGGALPLTIDGSLGTISATATNGDLVLMPNGTGSVVVGPVGAGLIQSDAGTALTVRGNTTLTLASGTGSTTMLLASGVSAKVSVSGPTAANYATGLAANDLTNKQYVDDAIQSGAASGSIKAVKMTVPLNADGTTSFTPVLPANATVLSVKVQVTVVDTSATLSIGDGTSAARYMTTGENDPQTTGLYLAEVYDADSSAVTIVATVASSTGAGSGSAQVIVTYQVA